MSQFDNKIYNSHQGSDFFYKFIQDDLLKVDVEISKLKDSKILITGASGLIGLYLVSYFKRFQSELNLDIYTWTKNKIDEEFSAVFDNTTNFNCDITQQNSFTNLPEFDLIIHASGYGQPSKFMNDKIKTIEINTISTINLFKKLKNGGSFLFISTSEIYSGNDNHQVEESDVGTTDPFHPRSCYIEGKRTGESICSIFKEMGYDVKVARLSLAYGPGTKRNDGRVLNSLIEKSILNDDILLMDSGSAIRTYCYVTDVIEMFLNIIMRGSHLVYNVGGNSKLSIYELANLIADICNKKVRLPDIEKSIEGSPKTVNVSIKRYINEFEKKSFIDLKKGLEKTILWQKKLYEYEKSNIK